MRAQQPRTKQHRIFESFPKSSENKDFLRPGMMSVKLRRGIFDDVFHPVPEAGANIHAAIAALMKRGLKRQFH